MNNILPNTKCAVLQSSLNDTEYSKTKAVDGKIRIFMEVMDTFAKVPVNSVRLQMDATKMQNRELLLKDFTNFCKNLFQHAQTYTFTDGTTYTARFQRMYRCQNVKVSGDVLTISLNKEFNAEELLGIDLKKIRFVKIKMPSVFDDELLKYTHLIIFCFMYYHLMNEDSIQNITILCERWDIVSQLYALSTEDIPLPFFSAEELKDADGNFIGAKLCSIPEEAF